MQQHAEREDRKYSYLHGSLPPTNGRTAQSLGTICVFRWALVCSVFFKRGAPRTRILYWELAHRSNAADDQYLWKKVDGLGNLLAEHDSHTLKSEAEGNTLPTRRLRCCRVFLAADVINSRGINGHRFCSNRCPCKMVSMHPWLVMSPHTFRPLQGDGLTQILQVRRLLPAGLGRYFVTEGLTAWLRARRQRAGSSH